VLHLGQRDQQQKQRPAPQAERVVLMMVQGVVLLVLKRVQAHLRLRVLEMLRQVSYCCLWD
jgi:hypothetical protein